MSYSHDAGLCILARTADLSNAVWRYFDLVILSVTMLRNPQRNSCCLHALIEEQVTEKGWRNALDCAHAPSWKMSMMGTQAVPNVVRDSCLADKSQTELPG
jgi:hypothetical protein